MASSPVSRHADVEEESTIPLLEHAAPPPHSTAEAAATSSSSSNAAVAARSSSRPDLPPQSGASASAAAAASTANGADTSRDRQPTRDDAILSVSKVLHRHILHSRADQEARDYASRTVYGSTRNTPRRAYSRSSYGSTHSTPRSLSRSSFSRDQSPGGYGGSTLTTPPPSQSLNSPAIGSPYSSLSTPPQMAIDFDAAPHQYNADIFDLDHYLARSYSVQVPLATHILPFSVYNQKRQYHFVPPPTVDHIRKFIKRIFDQARLNAECVIIALIYIERLMETRSISLTRRNWLPVVSTALLTASKVWDDAGAINAEFAAILPIFTLQQVNAMERTFLTTLSFELYISSTVYSQYYFGLRNMQEKATNSGLSGTTAAAVAAAFCCSNLCPGETINGER